MLLPDSYILQSKGSNRSFIWDRALIPDSLSLYKGSTYISCNIIERIQPMSLDIITVATSRHQEKPDRVRVRVRVRVFLCHKSPK